jgi:hypothetical protein
MPKMSEGEMKDKKNKKICINWNNVRKISFLEAMSKVIEIRDLGNLLFSKIKDNRKTIGGINA